MKNTNQTIKLMGTMTTVSPLIHIDSSDSNKTYCIKGTIPFYNEEGNLEIRQIPFVQGSSYRGLMRNIMAEVLVDAVKSNDKGVNLNTAIRLFSGGRMESGKNHSLKEARDILHRCIDLNLFGGIDGTMFKSNVFFDILYPITETTLQKKIVPSHYAKYELPETALVNGKVRNMLQQWVKQTRRDEVIDNDSSMIDALSPDAYDEAQAYLLEGIVNQQKKSNERKNKDKNDAEKTKKTIQKHYADIEAIPTGIHLFSSIEVKNVDKITMGLFLRTLQEFLKHPYIASSSRAGYGKVAVNYDLKIGDKVIENYVSINEWGDAVIATDKYGDDCLKDFAAWAKKANEETLTVQ